MKSFEAPKAISMALFTTVIAYGADAQGAGETLRCEARALQIEANLLRCAVSCRETAERRRSFNEERCLTKCQSAYDEAFSKLLCATDRRLVYQLAGVDLQELRREAHLLHAQARELRCVARCEYSGEPDACVTQCEHRYGSAFDITAGQPFEGPQPPRCTLSSDGLTLECEYGEVSEATVGGSGGIPFDAHEGPSCTLSSDAMTLECHWL